MEVEKTKGKMYLRIYLLGILFVFIYNTGSALLRALGDSKRPFYILFACIEIYSCALRGMGDAIVPMVMTILGICGVRVCWVLFLVPLNPSMTTIVLNYPVSWGLTSLFFLFYYRYKVKRLETNLF